MSDLPTEQLEALQSIDKTLKLIAEMLEDIQDQPDLATLIDTGFDALIGRLDSVEDAIQKSKK